LPFQVIDQKQVWLRMIQSQNHALFRMVDKALYRKR